MQPFRFDIQHTRTFTNSQSCLGFQDAEWMVKESSQYRRAKDRPHNQNNLRHSPTQGLRQTALAPASNNTRQHSSSLKLYNLNNSSTCDNQSFTKYFALGLNSESGEIGQPRRKIFHQDSTFPDREQDWICLLDK